MHDEVSQQCHHRNRYQGYCEHGYKFNDQFFDVHFLLSFITIHRNDHIPLFMPLLDITVRIGNLF